MKEDWQRFDRRMGHGGFEAKISLGRLKDLWRRLFGKAARGSESAHTRPDEIDRAIDEAISNMGGKDNG